MTYGELTGQLRETMTWLLERHRIGQRLGGPGCVWIPVTTTEAERAELGAQIQRHRDAVLTFCLEAVRAAAPTANLDGNDRFKDPVVALRYQLEVTHDATRPDAALSSYLDGRPEFELVRRWQQAARLSVEGERELGSMPWAAMSTKHARVILKDAADLARGLVVLDVRHRDVPGWRLLHQRGRLLSAATAASDHLANKSLDWSVDQYGWRPPPGVVEGPALPGLAGVLQAQHNVAVHLMKVPSALNLRRLLVDQAQLSSQAARIAHRAGSSHAASFEDRAAIYSDIAVAARTLGGELGGGHQAALESANAAHRISAGPTTQEDLQQTLDHLRSLDQRVDARVSTAVEHGVQEKLYFVAIKLPVMGRPGRAGVVRPAKKFVPLDVSSQPEVLALVRERLRPMPVQSVPRLDQTSHGRAAFDARLAESPRVTPPRGVCH